MQLTTMLSEPASAGILPWPWFLLPFPISKRCLYLGPHSLTRIPFSPVQTLGEAGDCVSHLPSPFAYLLTIHLKEGRNLVVRDRCGKVGLLCACSVAIKTLSVLLWRLDQALSISHCLERSLPLIPYSQLQPLPYPLTVRYLKVIYAGILKKRVITTYKAILEWNRHDNLYWHIASILAK